MYIYKIVIPGRKPKTRGLHTPSHAPKSIKTLDQIVHSYTI